MKIINMMMVVVALGVSACVSVPVAEEGSRDAQISGSFEPVADRGVIYIYWSDDSEYGLEAIPVSIGDAGKVDTVITKYARVEVLPGTYTLEAHTAELTADVKTATVHLKAGDVVFVRMKLKARFMLGAKGELVIVPPAQAKKEIAAGRLQPLKVVRL